MIQPFAPLGSTSVVAPSGSTGRTRLTGGSAVRICNSGTVSVFIKFGNSGVVATTSDMEIPAGVVEIFLLPPSAEFIAYITAGAAGALNMTTGEGV